MTDDFHDEQIRRLAAIGLVDEQSIAENENTPILPVPDHRRPAFMDTYPPLLSVEKIDEYAQVDGYIDACTDRPPSASIRFIEARLHYNCMDRFARYVDVYTKAYNEKRRAA